MPKPTVDDLYVLILAHSDSATCALGAANMVWTLIDAWSAEDETERERGRHALEIARRFAAHKAFCGQAITPALECTCGLREALSAPASYDPATYVPPEVRYAAEEENVEDEEVERFNQEQRIRREAYAKALEHAGGAHVIGARQQAARVYPLKKRVQATRDDPHNGRFMWRFVPEFNRFEWTMDGQWVPYRRTETTPITPERVRALYALLQSPWTYEDDASVEEGA